MTHSIQNLLPNKYFNTLQSAPPANSRNSYREIAEYRADTSISIKTDEGDVVTIANYNELSSFLQYDSVVSPLSRGMNFTTSSLVEESMSLSVKGDLNETELLDIEKLLNELSLIADDFFAGNTEKALSGALLLNDFGSLSHFDASFSYSTYSLSQWNVNQLSEYHPLPTGMGSSAFSNPEDLFKDMPGFLGQKYQEEMQYSELLQAQWQQIKDFLDSRLETELAPTDHTPDLENDTMTAAKQMLNRFEELAEKHPRLAPFGVALAHRAVEHQAENKDHPSVFGHKNQLKENLLKEFNDWVLA